jgi:phosphatidylserine/phosphatidylglycerophosphate/cardiolipin synthase-like enzyme
MTPGPLAVDTLVQDGQRPEDVGAALAAWIGAARRTLDVALYTFNAPGPVGDRVFAALRDASARGVAVRGLVHRPDLDPTPLHATAMPRTRVDVLRRAGVEIALTEQVRDLMHHKFAVRDDDAVWTGSTNWTLDDFGAEENVIVRVESRALADAYSAVFAGLWATRQVEGSGDHDGPFVDVGEARVRAWFCPGRGRELSHRMADRITTARRRVRVASPIITAGPILSALAAATQGRADVTGIVDLTQTLGVLRQWDGPDPTWKAPVLSSVLATCGFAGKRSSNDVGRPGTVRDTMHAKVVVTDDVVFLGSFNLSRSGEDNAENVLEIEHPPTADRLAAWVDELRARYPPAMAALSGSGAR